MMILFLCLVLFLLPGLDIRAFRSLKGMRKDIERLERSCESAAERLMVAGRKLVELQMQLRLYAAND